MYIIPFYRVFPNTRDGDANHHTVKKASKIPTTIYWVFLANGGTSFWKTDEDTLSPAATIKEYLEPNGFKGKIVSAKGDYLFFEVDPVATPLSDFYTWPEFLQAAKPIPKEIDIWRPLLWVGDTSDQSYGWRAEWKTYGKQFEPFWEMVSKL